MGVMNPGAVIKNIMPVILAGILGIYGLIVAVVIQGSITTPSFDGSTKYSSFNGYAHLASGLCCGLSGLAAGMCIGIVGDAGAPSDTIVSAIPILQNNCIRHAFTASADLSTTGYNFTYRVCAHTITSIAVALLAFILMSFS